MEEVRIPVPMSEPKRRPPRRPKTRLGIREDEEMKVNTRSSESEREKPDRVGGSETETASSHSDKENDRPNSGRPIYKVSNQIILLLAGSLIVPGLTRRISSLFQLFILEFGCLCFRLKMVSPFILW